MKQLHQKQVERAMQSVEGIKRAEASPFLFGKILMKLEQHVPAPVYYSGKMILRFAMMLAVVVGLNTVTIIKSKPLKPKQAQGINEEMELMKLAQEYFETDNLYQY